MFKVKANILLPICIYQFLWWHLSCVSQRNGRGTGDGPGGSQEEAQLCWGWCPTPDPGSGDCASQCHPCGRGYLSLQFSAGWTEFPVHGLDLRLTFTTSEMPLWYRFPVRGVVHTEGSGEGKGKMLLVHPWGLSWALHGLLHSYTTTCGAHVLQEMILCTECCFDMWENWVSLAIQLLWLTLDNAPCLTCLILLLHRPLWS